MILVGSPEKKIIIVILEQQEITLTAFPCKGV